MPTPDHPHPLTKGHIPLTLGHEFSGRIASVPSSSSLKKGQAVMVDPRLFCRDCRSCNSGQDNLCPKGGFLGLAGSSGGGGLSEYVAVEESLLHPLPENVKSESAAVIEPLAVAYHAIRTPGIDLSGLDVLILGAGPIGYAVALMLHAENPRNILISEPTARRKAQAEELVQRVIDPRSENVGEVCRQVTDGKGVDIVFDCAGIQAGLNDSFDALATGGYLVEVAIWETSVSAKSSLVVQQLIPQLVIPFWDFFKKEIRISISFCYNQTDFREVMKRLEQGMYAGYERMVTKRISLEDVVKEGFEELATNRDEHIKILISPTRSTS
ncbi:putative diacetyl reductase [(R)-acetoin forming] 2 [Exophiala sideris]|nr:putative diacetyl reductase [(R)-acetoin forming] 2 [Exophiala sideris]